jgi:hypothetical protein
MIIRRQILSAIYLDLINGWKSFGEKAALSNRGGY